MFQSASHKPRYAHGPNCRRLATAEVWRFCMRATRIVAFTWTVLLLAACSDGNQYVAPPPPKVTVSLPAQQPLTRYLEATGNLTSVNTTDVVARVPGFIEKINYEDGAQVK